MVISLRSSPGNPIMGKNVRKIRAVGPGAVFSSNQFVGKSTAQIGRTKSGELVTGDVEIYEKWSQALGSAFDLVVSSARDCQAINQNAAATVVFPVLVIPDGILWTVDYASDGQQLAGSETVGSL